MCLTDAQYCYLLSVFAVVFTFIFVLALNEAIVATFNGCLFNGDNELLDPLVPTGVANSRNPVAFWIYAFIAFVLLISLVLYAADKFPTIAPCYRG